MMECNALSVEDILEAGEIVLIPSDDVGNEAIVELETHAQTHQPVQLISIENRVQIQDDPAVFAFEVIPKEKSEGFNSVESNTESPSSEVDDVTKDVSLDEELLHFDDKDLYIHDTPRSEKRSRKQKTPIKMQIVGEESDDETIDQNTIEIFQNGTDVIPALHNETVHDNTIDIFQNGSSVIPASQASLEAFISHFVTKQEVIPDFGLFPSTSLPTKKRSPKKTQQVFQCTQCNKIFNYKCNLQMHAAVHSNEKRYTCSICNKSFKLKGHLDTHRKVHEERYEFKCDICGKEFKLKGNIKTHIRTRHLDERTHQCTHCDMSFKLKQHLSNHIRIKHGISNSV